MNDYDLYKLYVITKLHMQGKVDITEKGLRCVKNITRKSLEKRNDRGFFKALSSKIPENQALGVMLSIFVDQDAWIGDFMRDGKVDQTLTEYRRWRSRMKDPEGYVSSDLMFIEHGAREKGVSPIDVFVSPDPSQPPFVLALLTKGAIFPETWCIIDHAISFTETVRKRSSLVDTLDPNWIATRDKMVRYSRIIFKYLMDPERVLERLSEKHQWLGEQVGREAKQTRRRDSQEPETAEAIAQQ